MLTSLSQFALTSPAHDLKHTLVSICFLDALLSIVTIMCAYLELRA